MVPHKYILVKICDDAYRWVIFCEKCGHVSFFGNATNEERRFMQESRPDQYIGYENPIGKAARMG